MKLLFIREQGRAAARRAGGIFRSGQEIERVLVGRGWSVTTHRDKSALTAMPDVDVAWHYGAYDEIDRAVEQAVTAKVPIIITSSYNNGISNTRWMHTKWQEWGQSTLVYFGLWSHLPMFDTELLKMRDQLVMMPKTLRQGVKNPKFKRRNGFAIGDMVKLQMSHLTREMDIPRAVGRMREAWPDEPVLAFQQHNHGWHPIPGVTVIPYQNDLLGWLAHRKLFVSLVVGETYAMVPMEAQSVGTPVIYRHQPQSLSQTIGQTGWLVRDEDDLLEGIEFMLRVPGAWGAYSRAGLHNSNAHQHYAVGLDLSLRSVIRRSRQV